MRDTSIEDTLCGLFKPEDRRPIEEWAADNFMCPAGLSRSGLFNASESRHFLPILAALQDDHVRQVVIRKPVRGGGTLLADIWNCWTRANDPGPAMVVFQSDDVADQHSETRLLPSLLRVPGIAANLPEDRHKIRKNEILFADGLPLYVNGPGINNLQTKGIRYMTCDEPWLYKPGTVEEAEGRLGDFARIQKSKFLLVSQAGSEDDAVDVRWKAGSRKWWHVPCLRCGSLMDLRWSGKRADGTRCGMVWDEYKDDRGHWKIDECSRTARYECKECGHPHFDTNKTKQEWNRQGKYVALNPSAPRSLESFHWNLIISDQWEDLVVKYLGSVNALKTGLSAPLVAFFQKRMAEPSSDGTISEAQVDFKLAEPGDWAKEHIRFMTVDRQGEDLFWVMIRSWSKEGESRRVYYGKAYGHAALKELADKFKCRNVFVDAGFEAKSDRGVYAICCRYDWVAFKGDKADFFFHDTKKGPVRRSYSEKTLGDPESGTAYDGRKYCPLVRFSSYAFADRVHALIRAKTWVEPATDPSVPAEAEYRRQMTAERKRLKPAPEHAPGQTVWEYVQVRKDNHAFDCAKMQVLAATLAGLLPDQEI